MRHQLLSVVASFAILSAAPAGAAVFVRNYSLNTYLTGSAASGPEFARLERFSPALVPAFNTKLGTLNSVTVHLDYIRTVSTTIRHAAGYRNAAAYNLFTLDSVTSSGIGTSLQPLRNQGDRTLNVPAGVSSITYETELSLSGKATFLAGTRGFDLLMANGVSFGSVSDISVVEGVSASFRSKGTGVLGFVYDYSLRGGGTPTARTPAVVGALAAVPEPAGWAMMTIGFGLVGGAMRRRRKGARVPA